MDETLIQGIILNIVQEDTLVSLFATNKKHSREKFFHVHSPPRVDKRMSSRVGAGNTKNKLTASHCG